MKTTLYALATLVGLLALTWVIQGNAFFMYKVFAPATEAVRRDTMIESRAYSEATVRRLYDLQRQYVQSKTDDERSIIAAIALHEASAFDVTRLPVPLQQFVYQLRTK